MARKRILITGTTGLLGQALVKSLTGKHQVLATGKQPQYPGNEVVDYQALDIANAEACKRITQEFAPDVIVNSAAFTHVDKCESERDACWQVNVKGVENLARAARRNMAQLVQLSTDYIFDGANGPYGEEDSPRPLGYYGKSKLAAENAVRAVGIPYAIVRTNVIFGAGEKVKNNFFLWLFKSLKAGQDINVVTDQWNNPIDALDLAMGIAGMINQKRYGVYHLGGTDYLNRFQFAEAVADVFGFSKELIHPITTDALKQPAPRPLRGGLKIDKAKSDFGFNPRSLREVLTFYKEMAIVE